MPTMDDAVRVIAERHAAEDAAILAAVTRARQDRDLLARLVREGRVSRDPSASLGVPGRSAFVADIERRVSARRVDLAIRPKKKKKRR